MLVKVQNEVEKNNQRLVIVKNFGLINYTRLYENYHGSFSLRLPDNPITDLRIANPWNELKEFCMSFDFDKMEEIKHKHIPYVIILIQALEKYKLDNSGKLPSNTIEKNKFKEIIKSFKKIQDEENFNEALNYYYFANSDRMNLVTEELNQIFAILKENSLESLLNRSNVMMSIFFIVCKALLNFYNKFGTLPVVGNISDMTSDTENYITLKKM